MKRFRSSLVLALALILVVSSVVSAKSFSDVNEDDWFFDSVINLVARGGIAGYTDGTFKPNGTITFSEFLKMSLSSATGKEFPAKKGHHWASGVYEEAVRAGIIDGKEFPGVKETLNKAITREDMTMIMLNINIKIQGEANVDVRNTPSKIKDMDKISVNRKGHVLQAYEKGLIAGKPEGFDPKGYTTRAEAATVIMRVLDKEFRVDPTAPEVETPAGAREIKWNDTTKPFDPKVGDVFIKQDGTKVVLKEQYGILGGGQGVNYYKGTVINGIKFDDKNVGGIGMRDTVSNTSLDGQPYWEANGEAHFRTEWMTMAELVIKEFKADMKSQGIDIQTLGEGIMYHNNWIVIEGGIVNFTGSVPGFDVSRFAKEGVYWNK